MENIIFLDIDGVISPNGKDYHLSEHNMKRIWDLSYHEDISHDVSLRQECLDILVPQFDIDCVKLLLDVLNETNAKLVLHSSWRRFPGLDITRSALHIVGLPQDHFHEDWFCPFRLRSEKINDIDSWLANHELVNYIIVEDENISQYTSHIAKQILIHNPDIGLQEFDCKRIISTLLD